MKFVYTEEVTGNRKLGQNLKYVTNGRSPWNSKPEKKKFTLECIFFAT